MISVGLGPAFLWVGLPLSLPALLPVSGPLGLVGFNAPDIVWGAFHQRVHEIVGLFLLGRIPCIKTGHLRLG